MVPVYPMYVHFDIDMYYYIIHVSTGLLTNKIIEECLNMKQGFEIRSGYGHSSLNKCSVLYNLEITGDLEWRRDVEAF